MSGGYRRKDCKGCGKTTTNKVYCSRTCNTLSRVLDSTFNSIEIGELPHHPITAKNQLRLFHGNVCKICGITEWLGKEVLLILDHIDGNSSNWKIENLRLICSNCDAQLPTYKFKNKGNGRFNRMQRYQQGLSH